MNLDTAIPSISILNEARFHENREPGNSNFTYSNFSDLSRNESAEQDYRITSKFCNNNFLILVPHGGIIEAGTSELGREIAGESISLYLFEGITEKNDNGFRLHLNSRTFDEPTALAMIQDALIVVTIHGCTDRDNTVYLGGKNEFYKSKIQAALKEANFKTSLSHPNGYDGKHIQNICNRGKLKSGVQIEISQDLRERLMLSTDLRASFVNAIRSVLAGSI